MELSPLFSDDSRVAEAASIAQKLRKMASLSYIVIFSYIFMSELLIGLQSLMMFSPNLTAFCDPFMNYSFVSRISCEKSNEDLY